MSSYWERVERFYYATDPCTLLASTRQIDDAKGMVNDVKQGKLVLDTPKLVQEHKQASRLVESIFHPETDKPIFMPFRFSAFLPMNFVILLGMLHPTMQTPARSMFWQLINQTVNVGVNYCNASASSEMSNSKLLVAYSVAVASSCGAAFGLNTLRQRLGPRCPPLLSVSIPFIAVVLANIANVSVIRSPDLIDGIPVQDRESGEAMGSSKAAGRIAVAQVVACRVMIPMPLMLIPPVVMNWLTAPKSGILSRFPKTHMPAQIVLLLFMLRLALPFCIAVFPQVSEVPCNRLEPEFQAWRSSRGQPCDIAMFNKGL